MPSRMKLTPAIISLVLLSASPVSACTLAPYFYQITALRGRVVGTHSHHRFAPRWLRQSFIRKHAKLALYEYTQPWDETLLVKTIETDDRGSFDFGPLKLGHYTLRIDDNAEVTVLSDEQEVSGWRQSEGCRYVARDVCARRKG